MSVALGAVSVPATVNSAEFGNRRSTGQLVGGGRQSPPVTGKAGLRGLGALQPTHCDNKKKGKGPLGCIGAILLLGLSSLFCQVATA